MTSSSSNGRFPKGKSGNPAGRPRKKTTSFDEDVVEGYFEKVGINKNGKRRRVAIGQVALKQMWGRAANGSDRATKMGLDLVSKAAERLSEKPAGERTLSTTDQEIVAKVIERMHVFFLANQAKDTQAPSAEEGEQ